MPVTPQRWRRIIPVALVMYTIAYVDRTNISLALDPSISSMMRELGMNEQLKGFAAGIFFPGYLLLQAPGGYLAGRWSARKVVSLLLIFWGIAAVGCGLARTYNQFCAMRFLLGMAESGVFPATTVLLAGWFPRAERVRATAYWCLCQPLAIVASAPVTSSLLGAYGWKTMLILEGALPLLWLPLWWFCIRDHPREAKWISTAERTELETTLRREAEDLEPAAAKSAWSLFAAPTIYVMIIMNLCHNSQAYGCMTFFTEGLRGRGYGPLMYGILFAIPYALTAVVMVINSRHSDKTHERRGHVAAVYVLSGVALIGSVYFRGHFWISYACLCLAIPGPFAALAPFWAIPTETLPRNRAGLVIGLVNACGNLGGFFGPLFVGWLKDRSHSLSLPFDVLGAGMLVAAALAFLLPKAPKPLPMEANIAESEAGVG